MSVLIDRPDFQPPSGEFWSRDNALVYLLEPSTATLLAGVRTHQKLFP